MYEETVFENGVRLLTVMRPHAYSVAFGVWIGVGSRYESDELAGASHFIEHMLFKGTSRRPTAREVALAIEGLGGICNASTSREVTTYWAKVGRVHLPQAADTIFDMLRHSLFEPGEVEKERQVITEEINESLDLPDELVYLQLHELLWPHHPLGRDIAGSRESLATLSREMLLEYMNRHYSPSTTIVAVAGAVSHAAVRALIAPFLEEWPAPPAPAFLPAEPRRGPKAAALAREIEQAHFCLGVRTFNRSHPDRYALSLLNAILGDGMSSRLFVELRERLGLAYNIYSSVDLLRDTGSFVVYAGVAPEKLTAAVRAVLAEWDRMRQEEVAPGELQVAKEYVKGHLLLRLEDTAANASWVGNQAAMGVEVKSPEEVIGAVDAVTAADIQRVARELLAEEQVVLSVVGPVDPEADWTALLRFA
ncbi:MAG: insulinase family protein [Ardenticatenaceae bacterium]|nr:insulinase family protein [Ardenticatenaceae bacterium]